MRILLDTGILLRLVNRSAPEHRDIVGAVLVLRRRGDQLVTTAQNIVEFWNVLTRPAHARGGFGRTVAEAVKCVEFFQRMGDILLDEAGIFENWKKLVRWHGVSGKAVHDARVVAHMEVAAVSHMLTLNPRDFERYSGLTVLVPTEIAA